MVVLINFLHLHKIIESLFVEVPPSQEAAISLFQDEMENPSRFKADQLLHLACICQALRAAYKSIYGPMLCPEVDSILMATEIEAIRHQERLYKYPDNPAPSSKETSDKKDVGNPSI